MSNGLLTINSNLHSRKKIYIQSEIKGVTKKLLLKDLGYF